VRFVIAASRSVEGVLVLRRLERTSIVSAENGLDLVEKVECVEVICKDENEGTVMVDKSEHRD
jgi:hypothetical protein